MKLESEIILVIQIYEVMVCSWMPLFSNLKFLINFMVFSFENEN